MEYSSKLKSALKMIQNGQRLSKQEFREGKKKPTQNQTHLVDSDIKQSRRLNTLLQKRMELL